MFKFFFLFFALVFLTSPTFSPVSASRQNSSEIPFRPLKINNSNQIIGTNFSENPTSCNEAYFWDNGNTQKIEGFGGVTCPRSINSRGQVVGYSYDTQGNKKAFLWEKGNIKELDNIGFKDSEAWDINNRGQVVGCLSESGTFPVLWDKDKAIRLAYRYPFSCATAINDHGIIAGQGPIGVWSLPVGMIITEYETTMLSDITDVYDINSRSMIAGCKREANLQTPAPSDRAYGAILYRGKNLLDESFPCVNDINNRGSSVGGSSYITNKQEIVSLNFENQIRIQITGINDSDDIVGWYMYRIGEYGTGFKGFLISNFSLRNKILKSYQD